jgi:hypothetical protein
LVKKRERQLLADIGATEDALDEAQERLDAAVYNDQPDFDSDRIIALTNEVEGYRKGLKILQDLKAQLF